MCGLITSKDGIPLYGDIGDGNLNDQLWNREVLKEIKTSFLDPEQIIYVADSSLISKKNLRLLTEQGIRFISRLPARYKALHDVKQDAFRDGKWQQVGQVAQTTQLGATCLAQAYEERPVDGNNYRLVVYRSSSMDARVAKKLDRTIKSERSELARTVNEISKKRFACAPDAQAALDELLKTYAGALHRLSGEVIRINEAQRPPGRPRKDAQYSMATYYQLRLRLFEPSEKAKEEWLERENAFVLIANLPADTWDERDLLIEY